MSKNLKITIFIFSFFAICATATFLYFSSISSPRSPASDGTIDENPRWNATGVSKGDLGGQY